MDDLITYPSNSKKSKNNLDEKTKFTQITKTKAKTKKKNKFLSLFVTEDGDILSDVIIPAAKKMLSEVVKEGIDILMYGKGSGGTRFGEGSKPTYTSYNKYYDRNSSYASTGRRMASAYSFDDVILSTRAEANEVLDTICEAADRYGFATVNDLYDLVGIRGNYTDNKYGWKPIVLTRAEVIRYKDGYLIQMPNPSPID